MDKTQLIENVIEQIKEIQLKLGFAKETTRLYFPVESLCRLLRTEPMNGAKLLSILESDKSFDDTVLGHIRFFFVKGKGWRCGSLQKAPLMCMSLCRIRRFW